MEAQNNRKKPDISTQVIIQMYKSGLTTTQIGVKLGLNKSSVARRMKKLGISLKQSSDYSGKDRYWLWKGENYLPEITRKRNQRLHRKWSNKVQTRDHFTCQDCGKSNVKLHAHHLVSLKECLNTKLEYEISNGITLCTACHGKRHKELNKCRRDSRQ